MSGDSAVAEVVQYICIEVNFVILTALELKLWHKT